MSEPQRNVLVGFFMVAGLGVLGTLMVTFGEAPAWLGGAEYALEVRVDEIAGVEDGTPVYLNGIKIGRATALEFVDEGAPERGVVITTMIKNRFRVPANARAECEASPLGIGRGRIEILALGEGLPALEPGTRIEGLAVNPLEGIIPDTLFSSVEKSVANIGDFAAALTPVAEDLHELLQVRPLDEMDDPKAAAAELRANLFTAVQRLDGILKNLDRVLGDPEIGGSLRTTVTNFEAVSADGREAVAALRRTAEGLERDSSALANRLQTSADNFDQQLVGVAESVVAVTETALPLLNDAARTAANLNVVSARMRDGQGTVGRLLADDRLYEVLLVTMERMRELVESLRRLALRFEDTGRVRLDLNGIPADKRLGPGS